MQTATTVITSTPVKTAPAPTVESFVQPNELCDTQRRNMAYDAFASLSSYGF